MEVNEAHVLLIEDDRLYREFLKTLLYKNLDVTIEEAKDPKIAFDYLKENVPDLIILDMELPMMDGFQVLKHIRSNPKTKNVAVIPCTVLKQEHLILTLVKLGISDFIDKKIPPKEILKKIRKVLTNVMENKEKENINDSDDFLAADDVKEEHTAEKE